MLADTGRKTPEQFLRECQLQESAARSRHLKIFLGYASGVGKTVRMLDEARRRRERGQDVVVGAIQPVVSEEAQARLRHLEVIPLKPAGKGAAMDLEALIHRRPAVCIIDGLAYDNPRGSRHATRWQDVEELLNHGIKVIGSINIQYVDELRAEAEAITGKHVLQTVPVAFIKSADEIEVVDAPAEQPLERSPEARESAAQRAQSISRLREMALVLAAEVVDHQLNDYLERQGFHQHYATHERIMVCVTPRANAQEMIDAARTVAERFHGEWIVAYVHQPELSADDQAALDRKLALAREAGAKIEILEGEDAVHAIVTFARTRGVTQLFIGHSQRSGFWQRIRGTPVDRLLRLSGGMDVRVFPQ
jgi:two-component system sensor histidine kinase KdpD